LKLLRLRDLALMRSAVDVPRLSSRRVKRRFISALRPLERRFLDATFAPSLILSFFTMAPIFEWRLLLEVLTAMTFGLALVNARKIRDLRIG